jgi:hypothetical protein
MSTDRKEVGIYDEILLLSPDFLSVSDKESGLFGKDPFCFDLVFMPFMFENQWVLVVLDNRSMVVKKGYSYLRYYSLTQFASVPSFVNEVRLRFMSDYVKRFSSEKNQSVVSPKMLITYDLFDSFPYFSDLFICSVARSFVFGKVFSCSCDILILKNELLSDF